MKRKLFLALLSFFLCVSAFAGEIPGFMGIPWGTPKEETEKQIQINGWTYSPMVKAIEIGINSKLYTGGNWETYKPKSVLLSFDENDRFYKAQITLYWSDIDDYLLNYNYSHIINIGCNIRDTYILETDYRGPDLIVFYSQSDNTKVLFKYSENKEENNCQWDIYYYSEEEYYN